MPGITVPSTVPCSHPCSFTVSGLFPGLHVRSIEYAYIHIMFPDMLGADIAGICMLRRIFMAPFNMRAEKGSWALGRPTRDASYSRLSPLPKQQAGLFELVAADRAFFLEATDFRARAVQLGKHRTQSPS